MSVLSILMIGIGLAMDACAISVTIGVNYNEENKIKMAIKASLFFGFFQGLMPLIGWAIGNKFIYYINNIGQWVSFILLSAIGGKMIYEAIKGDSDNKIKNYSNKTLLLLAIATSIDALVVGVSFVALNVNILFATTIISIVTLILCFIAFYIGEKLEELFKNKAEIFGGSILILIGIKILAEHYLHI